ncbi:5840_t:CDS:2, partial [Racocetra persica]
MKESLTSSNILNICYQIEDSMTKCWEAPLIEAYIASYLDLRFKKQTEMDQFFDSDNQSDYLLDNELER